MAFWSGWGKQSSWPDGSAPVKLEIGLDIRHCQEWAEYTRKIGWIVEKISGTEFQIFVRKFGIFGSVAKIQRVRLPLPWGELNKMLKKYRVFFTIIEPMNGNFDELKNAGFKKEKDAFRATKTTRIDLSGDVLAKFKRARSWINKLAGEKHKIEIGKADKFFEIWKKATKIQHLWSSNKAHYDALVNSFGKSAFTVTVDDMCGCLVLTYDGVAYYYYGAALPDAKRKSLPYLYVWEAMKEAKKRGAKIWDWEGVYDPRYPNRGWKGFTQFKKTFGGEEVWFPGTFGKRTIGNFWPGGF
ncbi:MAG: methicillin resistance protein [Microgenomates group bacterium Gr01-1014_16]|nr:MAG: methicillin resistance protein [Microgenomates group bacterium Gr01-1014_16]